MIGWEKKVVLGIDTSNYTTSVSVLGFGGELIANIKRPLPVKPGERGLRQSDAVFSHVKNIPSAMEEASQYFCGADVACVGVSTKPRNQEGSYMPCFLSGVALAEGIAKVNGIPLFGFSHQCGHIMAALYSSGNVDLKNREFGAFHISGGTTELVYVRPGENGFDTGIVGGTLDLNAGQVIDRVGVRMGLPFPAGRNMEELALSFSGKLPKRKPSLTGTYVNLSGLENIAVQMYDGSSDKTKVSAFVLDYIGRAVSEMCAAFREKYGDLPIVMAGGVMSNSIIKRMLADRFDCIYFAEPALSSDNAVGIAALALDKLKKIR